MINRHKSFEELARREMGSLIPERADKIMDDITAHRNALKPERNGDE